MKKPKRPARPVSFDDYQRIAGVIKAVLDGAGARTAAACKFYSIAGADLLRSVHGLKATPIAGAAAYRVDDKTGHTLVYAKTDEQNGLMTPDRVGGRFHCWVHCEDYAIDFMAPFFQDSATYVGLDWRIERRMFQKPYSMMARNGFELMQEGDFWFHFDRPLSQDFVVEFMSNQEHVDLLQVCRNWYRPAPRPMEPVIGLAASDGAPKVLQLPKLNLTGAW